VTLAEEAWANRVSLTTRFGARREGELGCGGEGYGRDAVSIGCEGQDRERCRGERERESVCVCWSKNEGETTTRTGDSSKDWVRPRTTIPLRRAEPRKETTVIEREIDFTSISLVYVE